MSLERILIGIGHHAGQPISAPVVVGLPGSPGALRWHRQPDDSFALELWTEEGWTQVPFEEKEKEKP